MTLKERGEGDLRVFDEKRHSVRSEKKNKNKKKEYGAGREAKIDQKNPQRRTLN